MMQNQTMNTNVATKRCPYCGETISANVQKCSHCGEWLITRYGKSWVKTYLLCSFLGYFGAHNFYNGKTGIAVAQLILTLTVFGSVISIPWMVIDAIIIFCGAYRDSQGLELSRKPTIGGTAVFCALGLLGGAGMHRFYTKTYCYWLDTGLYTWRFIYLDNNRLILILSGNFKDADGNLIKG